jgi:predicted DNA-binding WGR domain protein
MNFEQRSAAWKGEKRTFHQLHSRTGTRIWELEVIGNSVRTTWGLAGGKMQTVTEHFAGVNVGKANALSPSAYALDRAREMCRKKNWEGYRETISTDTGGAYLDPIVESKVDFDNLPLSLSFYKPDNSMGAGIEKKARAGLCWYTRKRNGMATILCKNNDGDLQIYSRRMLRQHDDETDTEFTWDDRFPHLIAAIEPHIPPRTILLGELVVEDEVRFKGEIAKERFDLAQSYIKSLTPKAVADMEKSGLWPFFYCWDIPFFGGVDLVSTQPMRERVINIDNLEERASSKHVEALVRLSFPTPDDAVEFAKKNNWEGFVVIDPDAPGYGDKSYNFKGKPDRPGTACAKLKPTFEDDFIAIWDPDKGYGERSQKGSRAGGIKSVGLYQYDTKGVLVFIANVNSGLTKEMLATLTDPKLWPQVWRVEYKGRRYVTDGDDTNALDFPAIDPDNYIRTDKLPNECVNERL